MSLTENSFTKDSFLANLVARKTVVDCGHARHVELQVLGLTLANLFGKVLLRYLNSQLCQRRRKRKSAIF